MRGRTCPPDCCCGRHPAGRVADNYAARHDHVRRVRGKAADQKCVSCLEEGVDGQAAEWARIHTESGLDPWADYVSLCRSHHKRYDLRGRVLSPEARENISAARRGKTHTAETRTKISASLRGNRNKAGK